MGTPLQDQQSQSGAVFETANVSVPMTYGNDEQARQAVSTGVALCDRSHWGRLRVTDADRLRFLHNQTTNQIQQLRPGEGCDTVFVNSTGRTLDLATAYVQSEAVLLLVSPGQAALLSQWMDRYIFFADKVHITDVTDTTVAFTLMGPESAALLRQLGLKDLTEAPYASHQTVAIQDVETLVALGSGLSTPGFTLITTRDQGAALWQILVSAGSVPVGEQVWQQLRIEQGRPAPGSELTDVYNPLEAGLWHTISFDKGCYIGQETIARLNTYQGVKQQLWGLQLSTAVTAGTPLLLEGKKVGVLTSLVETPEGSKGLGYIRTKAGGKGL
ncbi:MAG: folate-binding protein, partial [Cyanobacteria bacterium P01_H01_bin.58]